MAILKGKEFFLRPYKKGDEESLQKNINEFDICRYTSRIPHLYRLRTLKVGLSIMFHTKKGKTKNLSILQLISM